MKLLAAEEKELLAVKNQQYESYQKSNQLFMELQMIQRNEAAIIGIRDTKSPER